MSIAFSEYQPALPLQGYIQTYWTGDFNLYAKKKFLQSVVPNGCIELIIHLTDNHCELVKENCWGNSPQYTLIGLQTKSYEVRFNELVKVFGIRFNPEGIYTIFGVPPAYFTSTFEDSKQVFGSDFTDFCSRLKESQSINEQINITETFLLKKLWELKTSRFDYIKTASEIIRKHCGLIRIDELAKEVNISPRQLQRGFKKKLGITAKEYMRISRLNAIQNYMQGIPNFNLTELSYETGFSDQSHFIRDFKEYTGMNPKSFLKEKSLFIVNPVKN